MIEFTKSHDDRTSFTASYAYSMINFDGSDIRKIFANLVAEFESKYVAVINRLLWQ